MKHGELWLLVLAGLSAGALAQTCPIDLPRTAPDSRYALMSAGGEVRDTRTGLVWQRCALGQAWNGAACTGAAVRHTWRQALEASRAAGPGWSVPDIRAMRTLVERGCFAPAVNPVFFPTPTDHGYWSSTTLSGYGGIYALTVNFADGSSNGLEKQSPGAYVRLVRGPE